MEATHRKINKYTNYSSTPVILSIYFLRCMYLRAKNTEKLSLLAYAIFGYIQPWARLSFCHSLTKLIVLSGLQHQQTRRVRVNQLHFRPIWNWKQQPNKSQIVYRTVLGMYLLSIFVCPAQTEASGFPVFAISEPPTSAPGSVKTITSAGSQDGWFAELIGKCS